MMANMNIGEAKANVGRGVVYNPEVGLRRELGYGHDRQEDGVITSVNDTYVFVRYTGDQTAKATRPEQLQFLSEGL
jgi:hypothetical protein